MPGQLFTGQLFNDQFLKCASWSAIYGAGQILSDQFLKFASWPVIYWSDNYWSAIYRDGQLSDQFFQIFER